MENSSNRSAGIFFTRALLGIIFFMQGFGKIFQFTVPKVYAMFFMEFEKTILPKWLIWATAYYTSYIELIGGALLLCGLFRKYALYLLGLDLLFVAFGHGLMEPIWDLSHVMPRAALLITLLLLPAELDVWSLDVLVKRNKLPAT
jgi:uncharacterized membrane protein YphA (DoxX/SURF4 family)